MTEHTVSDAAGDGRGNGRGGDEGRGALEQRVADLEAYCEQQQATIDRLVTVLQAFGAASQLLD